MEIELFTYFPRLLPLFPAGRNRCRGLFRHGDRSELHVLNFFFPLTFRVRLDVPAFRVAFVVEPFEVFFSFTR